MAGSMSSRKLATCAFERAGLMPELAGAVRKLGFSNPSDVQALALPPLLSGKSVAMASSTGSGKTLAFLLPVMQQLREQELARPKLTQRAPIGRPRAVVLAPTRDLVAQIGAVAKAVSHDFRLRVRTVEGGTRLGTSKLQLTLGGVDLVVGTPSRLLLMQSLGHLSLGGVRHIVVDEADDMLLRGFDEDLRGVLGRCPADAAAEPPTPQMVFVSATLGGDVVHQIRRRWPSTQLLVSRCAHKSPPTLRHELRAVHGDKMDELRALLRESAGSAAARTLVFCRGVQSARAAQHALHEAGLPVAGCHGSMPEATRRADLAAFVADPPQKPTLVCTDVTARGIDFPHVERVVNFDFPATSSLYLHRGGRAARMGAPGRVLSLVQTNERRFAESLLESARRDRG
jgi:superfamily II DNA/RNA helicase